MDSKGKIVICMGSSCFARGNSKNLEVVENFIKERNLDAKIELAGSRCEGECDRGPNITINGCNYHNIDEGSLRDLLKQHFG